MDPSTRTTQSAVPPAGLQPSDFVIKDLFTVAHGKFESAFRLLYIYSKQLTEKEKSDCEEDIRQSLFQVAERATERCNARRSRSDTVVLSENQARGQPAKDSKMDDSDDSDGDYCENEGQLYDPDCDVHSV